MAEPDGERRAKGVVGYFRTAVIAAAVVIVAVGFVFPMLTRSRPGPPRLPTNEANLKQLGLVFKMYAGESAGEKYPPITPYRDVWMFDVRSVYPEYMTDFSILVNPELPDAESLRKQILDLQSQKPTDWETITKIAARSYVYTPWAVRDPSELKELAEMRKSLDPAKLDDDIQYNGKTFYRLCQGVEKRFISDPANPAMPFLVQSQLPVLFDASQLGGGSPRGLNLYMDGHASFYEGPVNPIATAEQAP